MNSFGRLAPWSLLWTNGRIELVLTLRAGTGAWAYAQAYFDRLPAPLARAAVAAAFEPWFAARPDGPWACRAEPPVQQAPGGAHVAAALAGEVPPFEFTLGFVQVPRAVDFGPGHAAAAAPAPRAAFAVPCEIQLATLRLAPARLARLRRGDWLLPAAAAPGARLCAGLQRIAVARLAPAGPHWQVTALPGPCTPEETSMNETDAAPAATPWERLELPVEIVIGRLGLPLATLQSLRVGDPLELPQTLDRPAVEVRVAGAPFARGTLVAFEGRLAVQLDHIETAAAAEAAA